VNTLILSERVALGALDRDLAVMVEVDTNVARKPTGYYIFHQQDGQYAIGVKGDADLLRRNGFLVDNRLI